VRSRECAKAEVANTGHQMIWFDVTTGNGVG
jgi:hypothetical protein